MHVKKHIDVYLPYKMKHVIKYFVICFAYCINKKHNGTVILNDRGFLKEHIVQNSSDG